MQNLIWPNDVCHEALFDAGDFLNVESKFHGNSIPSSSKKKNAHDVIDRDSSTATNVAIIVRS